MILELMTPAYLSPLFKEAENNIRQCVASLDRSDPEILAQLFRQGVTPDEVRVALARVQVAYADVAAQSEADSEATVFPRTADVAQLQSVLQRFFLEHNLTQRRVAAGAVEVAHPISDISLLDSVSTLTPKRLFGKMSQTDIRWIACLAAKAYRLVGKRHAFPSTPPEPIQMAENSRVYLIGDWGSGVSRARKIADRIRSMIEAEPAGRDQHVIHLGDVYYSGWPEEYDDHFLVHWPVAPGKEGLCRSWALNSNHEMFSGGHGYFDHLLQDSRFRSQHGRSFFSLENSYWQFLGLDSAWQDEALAGGQSEWVARRQAENPYKKLVLMTHHQPFSAFEKDCIDLQPLLERNQVTAWFWGHEHRFAMYSPRPRLKYGRLIGHGGVPVYARSEKDSRVEGVQYVSTRGFRSGLERFALFGFAVLDFADSSIHVRYIDEYGDVERSETLN
jgi:hypothetical protein